jgi:Cu2+-exporting ATPase
MISLSIAVFTGSAALVGSARALLRRRRNLGDLLAPSRLDPAEAEARECERRFNWSAVALGLAVTGRVLAVPAGLNLVMTPLIVYLQWPWLNAAWADLVERRTIKIVGLMAITFTGGWIYGAYAAMAFAIFAYSLSLKITSLTRERSRQKLIHLFDHQPQSVWVLIDGVEVETPFQQVQAGDTVVAYAGQAIPVDGVVVAGMATVDQHRLTGEAQPVERSGGDAVLAATLVLRGWLHVRVERAGRETVAMQVAEILQRTTAYHLAVEQRGLKLAEDCVMPSVALSAVTLPFLGVGSAISVFFARPGVDMYYAGPLALLNFLYLSASRGILVKDGRSLELMHRIDTVVFDKTGTLTQEQPEVAAIHTTGAFDEWQVLAYAAAAEHRQSHPIAKAILAEAGRRGLELPDTGETRCEVGFGVQVTVGGQSVRVGSRRFIEGEGLNLPPALDRAQAQSAAFGHSMVFVAVDGGLAGAVELRPTLRPEAPAIVAELKSRGLKLAILSGDRVEPTRHLAERLGIDEYFADVLPEDKARHIERLQLEGRSVCFLGDGINDAIALKTAHVSVSLHGATSIAQDAAQIVLMDQSLNQLPALFDLSRRLDFNLNTSFRISVATGAGIIGSIYLFGGGIGAMATISAFAVLVIISNAMLPLLGTLKKVEGEAEDPALAGLPRPDER